MAATFELAFVGPEPKYMIGVSAYIYVKSFGSRATNPGEADNLDSKHIKLSQSCASYSEFAEAVGRLIKELQQIEKSAKTKFEEFGK